MYKYLFLFNKYFLLNFLFYIKKNNYICNHNNRLLSRMPRID